MLTEEQKRIVEENYKLVPFVINRMYLDFDEWHGLACIALCEAAQKYDPAKGAFSTFAVFHIKREILKQITAGKRKKRDPGEMIWSLDKTLQDTNSVNTRTLQDVIGIEYQDSYESVIEWKMLFEVLEDREREFLRLHISGYRMMEIAKVHQTTHQNVSRVINRARRRLKEAAG